MNNWKPIETSPKDRPFLAREGDHIYKVDVLKARAEKCYYINYGLPSDFEPEPEEWCEIPE